MGLLKFLIISICIYYIVRSLSRIFLPIIFKNVARKMQNQATNNYSNTKPEGTISVDYVPPQPKNEGNNSKKDEFIDFEEIK